MPLGRILNTSKTLSMKSHTILSLSFLESQREPTQKEINIILLLIDVLYIRLLEEYCDRITDDVDRSIHINSLSDFELRQRVQDISLYHIKMKELGFCFPIPWIKEALKSRKLYIPSEKDPLEKEWIKYFSKIRKEYYINNNEDDSI